MAIVSVDIDLAKNVFAVHGIDETGEYDIRMAERETKIVISPRIRVFHKASA